MIEDPCEALLWNVVQDAGHLDCGGWRWSFRDGLLCDCGALPARRDYQPAATAPRCTCSHVAHAHFALPGGQQCAQCGCHHYRPQVPDDTDAAPDCS